LNNICNEILSNSNLIKNNNCSNTLETATNSNTVEATPIGNSDTVESVAPNNSSAVNESLEPSPISPKKTGSLFDKFSSYKASLYITSAILKCIPGTSCQKPVTTKLSQESNRDTQINGG